MHVVLTYVSCVVSMRACCIDVCLYIYIYIYIYSVYSYSTKYMYNHANICSHIMMVEKQ